MVAANFVGGCDGGGVKKENGGHLRGSSLVDCFKATKENILCRCGKPKQEKVGIYCLTGHYLISFAPFGAIPPLFVIAFVKY
eukprot:scaffold2130_cov106-Skeletonema_dohrnii-CCMP3373.AAC.2